MRPQVILIVTLALLAVLAALPLGEGAWPCCNDCGICNRMIPPKCRCNDISAHGCHPKCKKCVTNTLTADDDDVAGPVRAYYCEDMITNFCERRCTKAAPAAAFLSEVV